MSQTFGGDCIWTRGTPVGDDQQIRGPRLGKIDTSDCVRGKQGQPNELDRQIWMLMFIASWDLLFRTFSWPPASFSAIQLLFLLFGSKRVLLLNSNSIKMLLRNSGLILKIKVFILSCIWAIRWLSIRGLTKKWMGCFFFPWVCLLCFGVVIVRALNSFLFISVLDDFFVFWAYF